MSTAPSIKLVAWEERAGNFVFVAVPDERGRYLRTDRSVVLVGCRFCHAIKGEPCKSGDSYTGTTHTWRRAASKAIRERADDLVEPVLLPNEGYLKLIEPRAVMWEAAKA